MLNKEQILSIPKAKKPFLEKEMGVKQIGLFGGCASDLQANASDVDICGMQCSDNCKRLSSVLLFLKKQFRRSENFKQIQKIYPSSFQTNPLVKYNVGYSGTRLPISMNHSTS